MLGFDVVSTVLSDGPSLDLLSHFDDALTASEVGVGWVRLSRIS
jgi:hypothetical protein